MKILVFGGTTEGRVLAKILAEAGNDVTLSVATSFGREAAIEGGLKADGGAEASDGTVVGGGAEASDGTVAKGGAATGNGATAGSGTSANTVLSGTGDPAPAAWRLRILADRLGADDMASLIQGEAYDCVVDATHPYAMIVTDNIRDACQNVGVAYYRLKRPESVQIDDVTVVPDVGSAVEILNKGEEKALLTIGSKELEPFTQVENYEARLFIRILPMRESLDKALGLGFRGAHILCMQGPFDREMNLATLKQTGAQILVTKDSGDIGGYVEKVSPALSMGCKVIVIARPSELQEGKTFEEILDVLLGRQPAALRQTPELEEMHGQDTAKEASESMKAADAEQALLVKLAVETALAADKRALSSCDTLALQDTAKVFSSACSVSTQDKAVGGERFFPLFVDLRGRTVLVVGGGNIAERRITILAGFGAKVTVVSPEVTDAVHAAVSQKGVRLIQRKYRVGDIVDASPFFVVTATSDREVNRAASQEAAKLGIPVSVADDREACSCYFPAIAENEKYIVGLVSKDGDHAGVKKTAESIRGFISI